MQLNPYLHFTGNAEEALQHYRSALGGEVTIMRFEGTPAAEHVPPDCVKKVMHGQLDSPLGVVMASDAMERPTRAGENFSISLQVESEAQAEALFSKLSEGGTVTMPLDKTFWAAKFGVLVDKFGVSWMVNCAGS